MLHGCVVDHQCQGAASEASVAMLSSIIFNMSTVSGVVEHAAAVVERAGDGAEEEGEKLEAHASVVPKGLGYTLCDIACHQINGQWEESQESRLRKLSQTLATLFMLFSSPLIAAEALRSGALDLLHRARDSESVTEQATRWQISRVLSLLDDRDGEANACAVNALTLDADTNDEIELDNCAEVALLPTSIDIDVSDGARLLAQFRKAF
jgi:hypothetical protein